MFAATDTAWAPWFVARSEDKKARASEYHHPSAVADPYEALPVEPVTLPKRKIGKMKQTNFPFPLHSREVLIIFPSRWLMPAPGLLL
ncbi:hypothetical protein LNP20_07515 [Klebsiella pneumoniae subsp. pneumoniae]|nr:hypothetical protein [Klebsiella pneumoniae subsp. pneumoniae]